MRKCREEGETAAFKVTRQTDSGLFEMRPCSDSGTGATCSVFQGLRGPPLPFPGFFPGQLPPHPQVCRDWPGLGTIRLRPSVCRGWVILHKCVSSSWPQSPHQCNRGMGFVVPRSLLVPVGWSLKTGCLFTMWHLQAMFQALMCCKNKVYFFKKKKKLHIRI